MLRERCEAPVTRGRVQRERDLIDVADKPIDRLI